MAWRNCTQATIGQIPQLIMSDATVQEYITAISNATTSAQRREVFNTYIKPLLANTYVLNANLTQGLILGISGNYVNLEIESSFKSAITYYNGSVYSNYSKTASGTSGVGSAFIAFIDDENQLGYFDIFEMNINNPLNAGRWSGTVPATSGNVAQVFYTILKDNEYNPVVPVTSNGGGATHIAKRAGLLSSIGASNLSDILMVSGGGGGGLIIGEDTYAGKDAGGIAGNGNNSANQTTGYAFGQGESADGVSGGGGGLYGGYKGGTS